MSYQEFIIKDRFKDKVTVVTGAGSGIGRQIALRLAKEGSTIAAFDINFKKAEETSRLVEEVGARALPVKTDVSNWEEVKKAVKTTLDSFGKINILVNNAGIGLGGNLSDMTEEKWNKVLSVNLTGFAFCIRNIVPEMEMLGKGKIVNISSLTALIGIGWKGRMSPEYTAAKGGIISLTRLLAGELAPKKINVNAICPGFIATPLNEADRKTELGKLVEEKIPWRRWGTASDIASLAAFLASDEADYITGAIIQVDGGASSYLTMFPLN